MYKKVLLSIIAISFLGSSAIAKSGREDYDDGYEKHYKKHKEKKHNKHKKDKERYDSQYDQDELIPYGLQKRSQNTGKPLPPGWQKKLKRGEIMEPEVYERGRIVQPVDNDGLLTISVEGKLVRLYQDTREIIDILK